MARRDAFLTYGDPPSPTIGRVGAGLTPAAPATGRAGPHPAVRYPKRSPIREHPAEQIALVAQRPQISQAVPAIGEHHHQLAQHHPRVVHRAVGAIATNSAMVSPTRIPASSALPACPPRSSGSPHASHRAIVPAFGIAADAPSCPAAGVQLI